VADFGGQRSDIVVKTLRRRINYLIGVDRFAAALDRLASKLRLNRSHLTIQMKTLKRVATEMALHVLAYNLKRVMNIMGSGPLMAAIRA
jgi:hypothetical protein